MRGNRPGTPSARGVVIGAALVLGVSVLLMLASGDLSEQPNLDRPTAVGQRVPQPQQKLNAAVGPMSQSATFGQDSPWQAMPVAPGHNLARKPLADSGQIVGQEPGGAETFARSGEAQPLPDRSIRQSERPLM